MDDQNRTLDQAERARRALAKLQAWLAQDTGEAKKEPKRKRKTTKGSIDLPSPTE